VPRHPAQADAASGDEHSSPYAGRWVARLGGQVVGQGGTPQQALSSAKASRFKEKPQVSFVPFQTPLSYSPLLAQVQAALPKARQVYLVGGAIRDALLGRPSHDLDFALPRNALKTARKVANALQGAYYCLDDQHPAGRVVLTTPEGERHILDFADFRGPDLESDLRGRDFTVNAIAAQLHDPQTLLDPLGGTADLRAGHLRACAPSAFLDDPVRVLRALRFAADYQLHILPETRTAMKQTVDQLPQVSPERLRDELFQILGASRPATSLRALEMLGALPHLLPELATLKGLSLPSSDSPDAWEHALQTLAKLEAILAALAREYDPETAEDLASGLIVLRLGRYRQQISEHLATMLTPERPLRPLLFLAALYLNAGKAGDDSPDYPISGAELAAERAKALRLSKAESERLKAIVSQQQQPTQLRDLGRPLTGKEVYRYFRASGEAGVDVALLSLADLWATHGAALPQDLLAEHLDVLRTLLEAWWEQPQAQVSPPPLLDGNDLIEAFHLEPGPQIGMLIEAVREAQANGEVETREQAKELVQHLLKEERQND